MEDYNRDQQYILYYFRDKPQFNNLREALGDKMKFIYAVETRLSVDPLMIRSISELNKVFVISIMIFKKTFKNY